MKITSIQGLRAIAAWLVVFHHVLQIYYESTYTSLLGWLALAKGSVGVDLFFVISGFVMIIVTSSGTTSAGSFLMRRLARIVPAYWLATGIFAGVLLVFPHLVRHPIRLDLQHLGMSLGFLSGYFPGHFYPVLTVGWSLNFEMLFYFLLALAIASGRALAVSHLERWLVPLAIACLVFVYPWSFPGTEMLKSRLLLVFVMGHALGLLYVRQRLPLKPWLGPLLIGAGIATILTFERKATIVWGAACTAIVWGSLCLERYFARMKWLSTLGNWSYSTYLVHPIVIFLAFELRLTAGKAWDPWLVALSLVLILAMSGLSFRYVELPGQRVFLGKVA